jgi:uncharacterized glyoxalase superfamily protein PhnB
LDFELLTDVPIFPGASIRWLTVAPKYGGAEIILRLANDESFDGQNYASRPQLLMLSVVGIEEVYGKLKSKGVTLVQEMAVNPWSANVTFQDSEGNHLLFTELFPPDYW